MKVRYSFVTNSSSSSFIVGLNDGNENDLRVTLDLEVDLSRFVERILFNQADLDKYNKEEYEGNMQEWAAEEYKQCQKLLERGGRVYILHVCSDNGDEVETLICNQGLDMFDLGNKVKIIMGHGR